MCRFSPQGDPGVESVYKWTSAGQAISMRGASGKADGKHTLTGPVYVCGAEPGDVIQVNTIADVLVNNAFQCRR